MFLGTGDFDGTFKVAAANTQLAACSQVQTMESYHKVYHPEDQCPNPS